MKIRRFRQVLLLLAGAAIASVASTAAAYPDKPITIVVPFAPGGANDVVVRIIQQPLGDALGQPVVVENRGGAGGNVGIAAVARARPDGYTLLMAASVFAVNPSLYDKVPYDPLRDFEQIAELSTFPIVYTVRPDLGVRTLPEFVAYAKARSGKLNYSTPGGGTLPHLAIELLKLETGIDMVHIPYPGAPPAAQALLGRTVEIAPMSITVALPLIQAGTVWGLAVSGPQRWPELPDIPTVAEAGLPDSVAETWQGIMVPAGTPKDVRERLAGTLTEIAGRPVIRDRLLHAGFLATGRGPEAFHNRIVTEVPKWKQVIEKAHITAQ
jgi:tripartite-type tricarboxylate transporter receptor subunit TctC